MGDRRSLEAFVQDYPLARAWLVSAGTRAYREGPVEVVPFEDCLRAQPEILAGGS